MLKEIMRTRHEGGKGMKDLGGDDRDIWGNKTWGNYNWKAREMLSSRPTGRLLDWRSRSELTDLLLGYEEWCTGHCGGVDPLRNGKRNCTQSRSR
jgi:hypothetical protein